MQGRDGMTEIHGRAGSNIGLLLTLVLAGLFVLGVILIDIVGADSTMNPLFLIVLPVLAVGQYFLKRRSPFGGHLIDYLQQILEAEPIPPRAGDPIKRY